MGEAHKRCRRRNECSETFGTGVRLGVERVSLKQSSWRSKSCGKSRRVFCSQIVSTHFCVTVLLGEPGSN